MDTQRDHRLRAELNHAVVTDQIREIGPQVLADIACIEFIEGTYPRQVEQHLDGPDL